MKDSKEEVIIIFPSIVIRNEWIDKLEDRYYKSKKDKDYRAWKNAVVRYDENIAELMQSGYQYIEIKDINYNLRELIENFMYEKFLKICRS